MTPALAAAVLICTSPGPIDGDTLRCADGSRVRLWGIDAPESHTPAGPAATRALGQLVAGQVVRCTRKGPPSYGRVVALCEVRGHDVAAELVRQGFAIDWPRFSGGYYRRFER